MNSTEIIEQLKDRVIHLENTVKVLRGLIGRLDSRLDHTDEKLKYGPPARKADSNEARVTQHI